MLQKELQELQTFVPLLGTPERSWCNYLSCSVLKFPDYLLAIVLAIMENPPNMSSLAYLFDPLFMMNYTKSIQKTYINFPFHILKISLHSPVKELTLAVLGVHGYFTLGRKAPSIH
jgi:hypothetical protein